MRATSIPLFAGGPSHSSVPLGRQPAGARSEGQGRPKAGASRASFTAASTLAGWRRSGVGAAGALAFALSAIVIPTAAGTAQEPATNRALASHPYAPHVADAARRFGIPEAWIWAVMRVESNGNSRAVSPAGAMGLMQIMPATWAELRTRHGLGADPLDVRDNIAAGAAFLRAMHDRYGTAAAMLAAYNAGPGRYDEHVARGRPLPAETRAYLARLASIAGDPGGQQVVVALPADPFAWRRAALFVRVANAAEAGSGKPSADAISTPDRASEMQAASTGTASMTADRPPASAASDTLFVARSVAGRPQ